MSVGVSSQSSAPDCPLLTVGWPTDESNDLLKQENVSCGTPDMKHVTHGKVTHVMPTYTICYFTVWQ